MYKKNKIVPAILRSGAIYDGVAQLLARRYVEY
jgi:hypothetical protein